MDGDRQSHSSHARHDAPIPASPPSPSPWITALFANQQRWLQRLATGRTTPPDAHPRVFRRDSLIAARTGQTGVICLDPAPAAPARDLPALLDAWHWLRAGDCGDALVWAAAPRPDLDLPLLARGLWPSFAPRWMVRDLPAHLPTPARQPDAEIRLARGHDLAALHASDGIPYVNLDQASELETLVHAPARERCAWLLIAREPGPAMARRVLGQAIVHVTDNDAGRFAGLYNLGVLPAARNRGIGTALTIAACNLAYDLGASRVGLNATPDGERIYAALGFRHLADGQTWLLPRQRLLHPPDDALVSFAIAIGEDALPAKRGPYPLPRLLANGETPLAFAARFCAPASARWLLDHGATPEIVPLWVLGFWSHALALLRDPAAVNRRIPPLGTTPLHEAVQRDDRELVRRLVAAGADLGAPDGQYRSTPLGWAEALGREEIAASLRDAMAGTDPNDIPW